MVQWFSPLIYCILFLIICIFLYKKYKSLKVLFLVFFVLLIVLCLTIIYQVFFIRKIQIFNNKYKIEKIEIYNNQIELSSSDNNRIDKKKINQLFFSVNTKLKFVSDSPYRYTKGWYPSYFKAGMDGSIDSFISCYAIFDNKINEPKKEIDFLSFSQGDSTLTSLNKVNFAQMEYAESNSIKKYFDNEYNRGHPNQQAFFKLKEGFNNTVQLFFVFKSKKAFKYDTIESNIMTISGSN